MLDERTDEPPHQALNVGCGTGVVSLLLAALGHDVTGIDVSSETLEEAGEKARKTEYSPTFQTGDAETLQASDDAYDPVTARHLIWTLPNPSKAIRDWRRVLPPEGGIVLIEGHWDVSEGFDGYDEIHDDLSLYDGRPLEELAAFLTEHGLENVEYEPLMDSVLWGTEPDYEQYITVGEAPR